MKVGILVKKKKDWKIWKSLCLFFNDWLNLFRLIVVFIALAILIHFSRFDADFTWLDLFDIPLFVSILFLIIAEGAFKVIKNITEDLAKVSEDFVSISDKYKSEPLVEYNGNKIPIVEILKKEDFKKDFSLTFNPDAYVLPDLCMTYLEQLIDAHGKSKTYNQDLIRVDNITSSNDKINITYSKTTFFNSLLTNRSQDVTLPNNLSLRRFYEPGPFLSPLNNSQYSNHLGVNIIVITDDHKVIFVKRSKDISIGKRKLGISVGASIKPKYFENHFSQIGISDIENSIKEEIQDELGVSPDEYFESFSLKRNTVSLFSELFEGGKPQLLMALKSPLTFKEHNHFFQEHLSKEKSEKMIVDGKELIGISDIELKEQLDNGEIFKSTLLKIDSKYFEISPAHLAVLALYFNINKEL
ncbi:hypothetical protein [Vagococcus carniphilus]|uniref:Uncharacterized protein n=1 Tax=Vagococcus carniphilus TaxID=218144 RepID=A0A430B8X0_9ENTE|nr:hypothetical protein [Vagococcus carniphilus]QNN73751.1 hypothetical protein H9L18_03920 [Vagococcus carniphilus]RSU16723.1 hypothetical protein CBF28_00630 [Vagococcus carniphilus]